jgi:tRNA-splicing endonuclease subunit Sen2
VVVTYLFLTFVRYAAYVHLRSKRWVVKPGTKFGVDWLLYKDGPQFYHASASVKVVTADLRHVRSDSSNSSGTGANLVDVSFADMRRLTRLCSTVSKQLVYLTVFVGPDVPKPPLLRHVRSVAVACTFVKRWSPGGDNPGDTVDA